ncbi:MAG: hypothetical protein JSV16_15365 [Candidatus Hydrogenedentota bacterium]|nr:MAG: hypothetical protein JSV16_15365 [Candidatus Hydrogenedentota bacterium]
MGLVTDKVDPRNVFDLRCMPRRGSRADMIQDIYTSGFKGAFLRSEISPNGAPNKNTDWDGDIARWGQADFRYNTPGRKKLTSDVIDDLPVQPEDTDGCHVYTMHAFEEWEKTGEGNEGPFQIYQDYGNCVDASWIEMMCSILAIQAADPARREQFKWLAAFCLYHTRGYCSDGWWGHAIAAAALRYGWCPWMLINVNGHQLDFRDEDTAERWASREACRNPSNWEWLHNWMAANFGWEDGGITELDIGGDIAALKKLHANKAHLHHGSNYTSGSAIMPGQDNPH